MKILYIDVNYKNSSTGNIVFNLQKSCIENGIESYVCYGRGPKTKDFNVCKFGFNFETYLHWFLTRITGFTGCYSYFSTKKLIRYIKKVKPNIVHIHELHAYFVNIKQLLLFLKKSGIPTIFTNHCEFLYTGKCGHSKTCNKYSNKCGHCPLLKEYPKSLFFDHTNHMLNVKRNIFKDWDNVYIVNPSIWLDNKMKQSFLKSKNTEIIHNAIDTNVFKYDKNIKSNNFVLSVAQNITSNNKGGKRVIDIAKQMKDVNFILVGAGNKKIDIPPNVKVYCEIKDKFKLAELYSKAKVFLILSEYENFPTTCLEAQCCGTKVIGYDVGGIKETIINNGGCVYPYLDDDNVIKAIKNIVNSNYDKRNLSKQSCNVYSFKYMFNQYLRIYKKMVK